MLPVFPGRSLDGGCEEAFLGGGEAVTGCERAFFLARGEAERAFFGAGRLRKSNFWGGDKNVVIRARVFVHLRKRQQLTSMAPVFGVLRFKK